MEISWLGGGTFALKDTKNAVIINPYTSIHSKETYSTILLSTSDKSEYNADILATKGAIVCDWPGEYEVGGILFQGVEIEGIADGTIHTAYSVTTPEKITFGFLGKYAHTLTGDQLEELGNIDVLVLSLKETSEKSIKNIHAQIDDISPSYVIPAFDDTEEDIQKFSKETGIAMLETKKSVKFTKSMVGGEITNLQPLQKS